MTPRAATSLSLAVDTVTSAAPPPSARPVLALTDGERLRVVRGIAQHGELHLFVYERGRHE